MKPLKLRLKGSLEVVFRRPDASLTIRLSCGGAGAPPATEASGPCDAIETSDLPSVETQLWQALRLLAECELYESAACLRREMAARLGMGGGDEGEDGCEGRG